MSDGVSIAIIAAVTGLVNTVLLAYINGHIVTIKRQTNGMLKKLGDAEHAKGKLDGAEEQRNLDHKHQTKHQK